MTFFRMFLFGVFCAGISSSAWAAACGPKLAGAIMSYKSGDVNRFLKYDCVIENDKWQTESTPLEWAIGGLNNIQDNYAAVKAFLDAKPELANSLDYGHKHVTMLAMAVRSCCNDKDAINKPKIVEELLKHGADVNQVLDNIKNDHGTISHVIVIDESKRKVTALDVVRAYIESANKKGSVCNTYGIKHCKTIEATLIENGAKTYSELQGGGSSAEQYEVRRDQPEVINTQTSVATSSVSISGTVIDAKTGEAVPYANIALMQSDGATMINNAGCTTDFDGKFSASFDNIPQDAKMRVSYVGYEQQLLSLGQNVQIALQPTQLTLETVVVSATICTDEVLAELKAATGERAVGADGKTFCKPTGCLEGYHLQEPEKVICVKDDDVVTPADTGTAEVSDNPKPEKPKPQIDQKAIDDAESAYSDAKANEQSLANRMLGGATMAATGIGGMQLAQGLAEQSADAKAEADMAAYLQTFQCRVADKTYKGGEFSIPVGGGNELIELYQQYVDMAADLKERKNALGLKAGIESEVVMDKANMGLYDDKGKGIENGTFASLYRASKGNEKDAAKLAAQKESAQTRVKAGAVAAGAGVVGGLVGNQLLNEKSGKKGTDSVVETVKSVVNKNGVIDDSVAKLTDKVVDDNILAPVVTDDAGDDEAKLKECLDYINGPDLFDWVSVGECTRLAVSVSNGSDVVYVLSDDEAASLSPMWNWGCYNAESQENDSRKVWVYGDGNREYSKIADEEKDACETVEKVKAFVAEHNKSCEEYDNRVVWNDGNKNVCVQKDWVPVENKVEESVEEVKTGKRTLKYREPCTEEDKKYYPVSDHAVITWYYNGKCVPQDITDKNPCEEGYELARDAKGKTQGWCKKSSKKKK